MFITKIDDPDVLQVVNAPLRMPVENETRVRILYTGVGFTDILMRHGNYIYLAASPTERVNVPGYGLQCIL